MTALDISPDDQMWTHATLWESVAAALPDTPVVIQDGRTLNWAAFDREADALAATLLAAGLTQGAKVAIYSTNRAEYLVACFAAFKTGLAPFNVNYRYGIAEVGYLLADGDAQAVIFEAAFAEVIERVRGDLPAVRAWIEIEGEGGGGDTLSYRDAVATTPSVRPVRASWGRSGEDQLILYTGGTTGMPKGVMWRQADLIGRGGYVANTGAGIPALDRPEHAGPRARMIPVRPRSLIACPLMHGTGLIAALTALNFGGCVILASPGKFDPARIWDDVEHHQATRLTIVGQPFAQPLLEALDANPDRWDLSSLKLIGSSGAMWAAENKQALLRHIPGASMTDAFSSSEAMGMGVSTTVAGGESNTARFTLGEDCAVFDDEGQRVTPGSGARGRVAVGGFLPLGYYKDPAKTAATFPVIEGRRWSMPGDWAEVDPDGGLILLGRGSQCINTGGEKVFPEEVEEALKRHPAVRDAAVTGVPDPRFGERICAVVERSAPAGETELIEHVRATLAPYKAPRHILFVDAVMRGANGKLDYIAVKAAALAAVGAAAT
jgi:acyl-CoA synthetase (AMP-forming)/AMP-acid ligase II